MFLAIFPVLAFSRVDHFWVASVQSCTAYMMEEAAMIRRRVQLREGDG